MAERPGGDGPRGEAPVSVAVVARDEEDRLPRTLRSVAWAAETVVVVDRRSEDRTAEVAREHGARVAVRDWPGYAAQKRRALELCRSPWALLLDADEVVSPRLAREIVAELSGAGRASDPGAPAEERAGGRDPGSGGTEGRGPGRAGRPRADDVPAGWEIPFHTRYLGRWLGRRGWYRERHLRLVRRERATVTGGPVHEGLVVDGPVGRLSGPILHRSYRDVIHHAEKIAAYARLKARGLREEGRRTTLPAAVARAAGGFLKGYVGKGRFLDGLPGLVWELMGAGYELLTYAHLRELGAPDRAGDDRAADPSP